MTCRDSVSSDASGDDIFLWATTESPESMITRRWWQNIFCYLPQECWWSTLADFEKPVMYFHTWSWFWFNDKLLKGNTRNDFCLNENGIVLLVVHHSHLRSGFHLWNHKVEHSTARFHQIGGEPPTTTKRRCLPLAGDVCERGGVMTS